MIRLAEDRIFIDGFLDVISISDVRVVFVFREYDLILEGEALQVAAFLKNEMIVRGKIGSLLFQYHA